MTQEKYTAVQLDLMARNQERADAAKRQMGQAYLLHPNNKVRRTPNAKQPVLFKKGLV